MIAQSDLPLPRGVYLSLTPALAASLLVHAAILFMLLAWVSIGTRTAGNDPASLAVRLVAEPRPVRTEASPEHVATEPPVEQATLAAMPGTPAQIASAPPVANPAPTPPAEAPARAAPDRTVMIGSVDVKIQSSPPVTSLPEALADRATGDFPVEVARLVRMPTRPVVIYPQEALSRQRQGSVLAWVIVAADGSVEATLIMDGEPDFAAAVEAALATTRFEPAMDASGPIRFYTLLRFDFSGGAPNAVAAGDTSAPAAPQ